MDLQEYKSQVLNKWTQFILMDLNGEYLESCNTLFDVSPKSINLFDEIPFLDSIRNLLIDLTFGGELAFPCINVEQFGYTGICDYLFYKIRYNQKERILWVIVNFSEHYRHLMDLQQQRNESGIQKELLEVEKRNAILAKELLVYRNEELKRLQKVKTDFFSQVSHEIRTPVNGILGMAELIRSVDNLQEAHEYAESIYTASRHLSTILNDVLDLSKLESGKITIDNSPFDLKHVVKSVIAPFKHLGEEKNVEVTLEFLGELNEKVVGDQVKLSQILYNILSNAVKFTRDGKIEVRIKKLTGTDSYNWVEFIIQDTGIGIPSDMLDKIFEPYEQVISSQNAGGTGLGLYITKQLVVLQQGKIQVESKLNQGTRFIIQLPFYAQTDSSGESVENLGFNSEPQTALWQKRILVGEDDPINQKLLVKFLEQWGASVEVANDGEEVIKKIYSERFDLLIIDYLMPRLNGLNTIEQIRKRSTNEINQTIPIILFTGESNPEVLKSFHQLEIAEIVNKPVEPNHLLFALKRIFGISDPRPFDLQYAINITGGNRKVIREMIEIFIESVPFQIKELKDAYIAKDISNIQRINHKLKPNFEYLGLHTAKGIFQQILKSIELKKADNEITKLIDGLSASVEQSVMALKAEINQWK